MKHISKLLFGITAILAVTFSLSNSQEISLSFYPFPNIITVPTFVLIFICLFVGFVCGMAYNAYNSLSKKSLSKK